MDDSRAAFEAVFAEHHTAVLRYVERRIDDREQARELTMDVFEIAWRRFDPRDPFRLAWLLQTARNVVGDAYRRRDRERAGISSIVAERIGVEHDDRESRERVELELALRRLTPADREVLELFYWDGLAAAEIAEVIGCRVAAVWKRLSRARDALRVLLAEPHPSSPASSEGMMPCVVE